jgi:hypothetical protein
MDHRLAFTALVALLIGAGTPLAFAWARLLPEDAPPFRVEPGSFPAVDHEVAHVPPSRRTEYLIVAPLLFFLTLAFVFRVPGFPNSTVLAWVGSRIPGTTMAWSAIVVHALLSLVAIGVIVFGALRPGPLRIPLIAAGALTLSLWFLAPLLQAALLSGS